MTVATPTSLRAWSQGPVELHHMRYRGFAATPHAHDVTQAVIPLAGRMHVDGFQTPSHFAETFKALRGHPPNLARGG